MKTRAAISLLDGRLVITALIRSSAIHARCTLVDVSPAVFAAREPDRKLAIAGRGTQRLA